MNRIASAFDHGKAFIAFLTCGDPDPETTAACALAAIRGGADLIELGIPFSDPTAEGPVIQAANGRALAGGMTTDGAFALAKALRGETDVPIVFMTYANVVFSYGVERFCDRCLECGVDGMILPDVPYEEKEALAPACRARGLSLISLIAPSSEGRIARIAGEAEGFLYVVSSLGVTGERSAITSDIGAMMRSVRENTDIPCAVGFGISSPEQAEQMAALSDGAIVGSAIVRLIAEYGRDAPEQVEAYVRRMKAGMA